MGKTVFTIGHGRLDIYLFIKLLLDAEVSSLVDVRSIPASRWSPDFNQKSLERHLQKAGISYIFAGRELGGRPPENELYDNDGHVLYKPLSNTPRFQQGIHNLLLTAKESQVVVLCSESLPEKCHRNLLIGRVLEGLGHEVIHLLHDGSRQAFDKSLIQSQTLDLFDASDQWRSLVKVRELGKWNS